MKLKRMRESEDQQIVKPNFKKIKLTSKSLTMNSVKRRINLY